MNVALLGHGTVGRGVVQIIESSVPTLKVTRILELPDRCTEPRMTSNFDDIANDPEITAVVECMGGLEPAHTYILRALDAGKSVVTSNKAVVAAYFQEFVEHAAKSGARLFIEATCGGGIPWIASILKAKRIDKISAISGIMNGTTNYIIEKMRDDAVDFDVALAEAQRLGYAERDPTADIDGIDVKNKTIIGTSVAFGCACQKDIPTTGIRNLKIADLTFLESRGYVVKLLGRATQQDGRYAAAVEPVCMPLRTLEADVPSNFNLVTLDGATIGTRSSSMVRVQEACRLATQSSRISSTAPRAPSPPTGSTSRLPGILPFSRAAIFCARRQRRRKVPSPISRATGASTA